MLEQNSRDFPERVRRMNANAEALTDFLKAHPAVEQVWYPESPAAFGRMARAGGGRGCLFSFLLRDEAAAAAFTTECSSAKAPASAPTFRSAAPTPCWRTIRNWTGRPAAGCRGICCAFPLGLEDAGGADRAVCGSPEALPSGLVVHPEGHIIFILCLRLANSVRRAFRRPARAARRSLASFLRAP